jgi:hypothetical protein
MIRVWEIPGSHHDLEIDHPDSGFSWINTRSSLQANAQIVLTSTLGHELFHPHPFQFIIH